MTESSCGNGVRAILALALLAPLAACESVGNAGLGGGALVSSFSGGDPGLASASDDYRTTVRQGIAVGALIGAIGGAGIAGAQGGDTGDILRGAGIGALIGGALGGVGGTAVAENKRRYVAQESGLDKRIAAAQAANGKLTRLVQVSRRLVAKRRAEAASLQRRSGPAAMSERRALLASVRADAGEIARALGTAERERADLRRAVAAYKSQALAGQARAASAKIESLRDDQRRLDGVADSLK